MRPALRPFRSSGSVRLAVILLSGPVTLFCTPRSSIGFGRSPACHSCPCATSTPARVAWRSGFCAKAYATSSPTVTSPLLTCACARRSHPEIELRSRTSTRMLHWRKTMSSLLSHTPEGRPLSHRCRWSLGGGVLLADGDGEAGRAISCRAVPGHGDLPRAAIREANGAKIAACDLVRRERGARKHRGHARHGHDGAQGYLPHIHQGRLTGIDALRARG